MGTPTIFTETNSLSVSVDLNKEFPPKTLVVQGHKYRDCLVQTSEVKGKTMSSSLADNYAFLQRGESISIWKYGISPIDNELRVNAPSESWWMPWPKSLEEFEDLVRALGDEHLP